MNGGVAASTSTSSACAFASPSPQAMANAAMIVRPLIGWSVPQRRRPRHPGNAWRRSRGARFLSSTALHEVQLDAVAALLLGAVHRLVRAADALHQVFACMRLGHAKAAGHV